MDPLESAMSDFLRECSGVAVIDGGFVTELKCHGVDLNDPIWSAKFIITSPHLICTIHLDYLETGADIIITASYQATIQGFEHKDYSREESKSLLTKSVEARDVYYNRCSESFSDHAPDGRILKQRPILVAASVGSYVAYLDDGSEYSGDYGDAMDMEFIKNFHQRRVKDFAQLLDEEEINVLSWLSFSSKDGVNIISGDSLLECVAIAENSKKIVAVDQTNTYLPK